MPSPRFVSVALDIPLLPPLTYKVMKGTSPKIGDRCVVPIGNRSAVGLIVGVSNQTDIAEEKQKSYIRLLNETEALGDSWLKLTKFASDYYQHSWGEVAIAALPPFFRSKPGPKYEQSLERLRKPFKFKKTSQAVPALQLNNEQTAAVETLAASSGFRTFVLHGVTGSGKTEVYLRMMERVFLVNPQAQVLFLVPEINLTPQLQERVRSHFPDRSMATLHSGLANGERARAWLAAHEKRVQILIGTRMAIFADMPDLDLIIVDEEHDLSYKAGDGIRYSARDLAVKLAQLRGIAVVLGSATPSLETWSRVKSGRYHLLTLSKRAVQGAKLPTLSVVNPKNQKLVKGLCSEVIDAISETLQKNEQVIIFLNRRGYAPVLTCPSCGWLSKCPHCSTYAVYHKFHAKLICHHCGWSTPVYSRCPDCGNVDLQPMGAGTQRIEETLEELWPQARILRIDRDSTQRKNAAKLAFDAVHAGDVDILVGTQMVAKGHDFKDVTLVGILDADQSLHFEDYRAGERTFQLLTQVSGRSGRDKKQGKVVLQTFTPNNWVLQLAAKQDYLGFYKKEINIREVTGFPPFATVIRILFSGENEQNCISTLNKQFALIQELRNERDEILFVTKMKSPVKRIEKKYRFQILIKTKGNVSHEVIQKIFEISDVKQFKDVSVFVEKNPQNMN